MPCSSPNRLRTSTQKIGTSGHLKHDKQYLSSIKLNCCSRGYWVPMPSARIVFSKFSLSNQNEQTSIDTRRNRNGRQGTRQAPFIKPRILSPNTDFSSPIDGQGARILAHQLQTRNND